MFKLFQTCIYSVVIFVFTGGCSRHDTHNYPNQDVIKIGEVETLTGSEAQYGTAIHRGIRLALDEVNSKGGVNGKKIILITLDDQGKSEEAAIATTKLITQHKVDAIVGAVTSSRSMAMAPIANRYQIPMLSPTATNPGVTQLGKGIFRTCFIDEFQGSVMAKFAVENLKAKSAAVIRDVKSDYSIGLANVFISVFKKGGGAVLEQSFSSGDVDYKAQLTAIRAQKPQVIFVPAYYSDAALILRQARELGIQVPILGTDGFDSPKLIEIARSAADNAYFSSHFSSEDKSFHIQKFISKFESTYGIQPDGISALGYDTAGILIEAFKRVEKKSHENIRDKIAETENYEGVTGRITFDSARNPIKSAVIMKLDRMKATYFTTIQP